MANSIYLSVQSAGLIVVVVLVVVLDQADRKALSLSLSMDVDRDRKNRGVGSSGRSGERKRGAIIGSASTYLLSDLASSRGGLCGPIGVYLPYVCSPDFAVCSMRSLCNSVVEVTLVYGGFFFLVLAVPPRKLAMSWQGT